MYMAYKAGDQTPLAIKYDQITGAVQVLADSYVVYFALE